MFEVKAYLRTIKVEPVVKALEAIGVRNLTVIDVMAVGPGLMDPQSYKYSISCVEKYSRIAKIEVVCADQDVDEIVRVIQSEAYTGHPGDGLITITSVARAFKIRTGESVPEMLQPHRNSIKTGKEGSE